MFKNRPLKAVVLSPKSQNVKNIVILCHGYGGTGYSMALLANCWKKNLPNTLFLCPNGPHVCDNDKNSFQWFSANENNKKYFINTFKNSEEILNEYIDKVLDKYKLSNKNLAIGGFSQGCMIALSVGVKRKKKLNFIIGYSGKLIFPEKMNNFIKSKPNIFLFHGKLDKVIPYKDFILTKNFFLKNNFNIKTKLYYKSGHIITSRAAKEGLKKIKRYCF